MKKFIWGVMLLLVFVAPVYAQGGGPREPISAETAADLKLLYTFQACPDSAISVAFSPDASQIAWGCWLNGGVHLWDLGFNVELAVFPANHSLAVGFSPDGKVLAAGEWAGEDFPVHFWDTQTGDLLQTLYGHTFEVRDLAFSPDGTLLATVSNDSTARLWHTGFGKQLVEMPANPYGGSAYRVAFGPDGKTLATIGVAASLWDARTGDLLIQDETQYVSDAKATASGLLIGDTAAGMIVSLQDGVRAEQPLHSPTVDQILDKSPAYSAFNAAGSLYAASYCLEYGSATSSCIEALIILYDVETGEEIAALTGYTDQPFEMTFSQDDTLLATAELNGLVKVWGIQPGRG